MGHHRNNTMPPTEANIKNVADRLCVDNPGHVPLGHVMSSVDRMFGKRNAGIALPGVLYDLQQRGITTH